MSYKITNLAHFTSLSKRPISSSKSNKNPQSIPSPKNSSRKQSNNHNSPSKEDELNLIRKKFLHKSKHSKSSSSYLSFASPINHKILNKQSKLNNTIKSQLILTSMDNSSIIYSKDKIYSYMNNSNYYSNNNKNSSLNKSLNNKSISISVKKKIKDNINNNNNNNTNNNANISINNNHQKKQFAFTAISSRKNSNDKIKSNEKENKNALNYKSSKINSISFSHKNIYKSKISKKSMNTSNDNSINNSTLKNIFNQNINFYNNNNKFSINFLSNYLKSKKKQKIKNPSNKSIRINGINNNSSGFQIKKKKIISSTVKASPRTSSNSNVNSITARVKNLKYNPMIKEYNGIKKNNKKNNNNNSSNLINNSMLDNFNSNNNNNSSNNITLKKNNSKNKTEMNKKIIKKNDKNIKNSKVISYKEKINNQNSLNQIHSKISKILSNSKKDMLKMKKNYSKQFSLNNSPKTKREESKKENDLKKEILENEKEIEKKNIINPIEYLNEKNVKKLKENLEAKVFNPSTSTLTTSNHDSNYYLKNSKNLSLYIISYKKKYNEYPETTLSFYKYGRLIGQGAFGKVNLGLNVLTGRVVAVKSFNKQKLNNETENKNKIFYETDLMKLLNHPNITKILEHFESEKYYLIIMEYINGGNLFSFVKKRRKLSEKTAKFLFRQIIEGIKYIHSKNIVHRDIKLENILIDVNNNIKICDFGIGKILENKNKKLHDQCGTPMYMAPEILLSNKENGYDPFPIDLWSAGIALYIMLSGTLPFSIHNDDISISQDDKSNNFALQYSIINNEPKKIDNISFQALDLLKGLLNKNPKKRFNCDDVLNHPWLNDNNINNNYKYHLFTKAEMLLLSKTYIDYRYANIDDIKENFTLSNLERDDKNNLKDSNANIRTKSYILAPYNSMKHYFQNDDESEDDDFSDMELTLENGIINFGNKVREFNMNYELNNNGELDNGMLINTKTETVSTSIRNNTLTNNNGYFIEDDNNNNINVKKEKKGKFNNEIEKDKMENILNKIQILGYDINYVKNCLKDNIICHATAVYYLMMNYENF